MGPGRVSAADRPLRVGIIGTGFIGEVHARAARCHGAALVAVAAGSSASTARAVAELGARRGEPDGFALVERDDIDVVHICTPNALHVPLVEAAAAAGKHVVCEKPIATDVAGADAASRAIDDAGVVGTVPFVYRFYPMVREARARLAATGSIRLVHGSYLQDWLSEPADQNWRVDPRASGPSRAFADIGSHWCDLVEFVTGDRIDEVCAELVTVFDQRAATAAGPTFAAADASDAPTTPVATEDVAMVMFRTVGGVRGSLVVSQVSAGHKNQLRFEIAADTGTVVFDQEHPDELWIGHRSCAQVVTRDPSQLAPSAARYVTVPAGHPQGYQDCFDAFVGDTYRAITEQTAIDGLPTFGDGRRGVLITDAVLRSAASHRWEPVTPDVQPKEDRS